MMLSYLKIMLKGRGGGGFLAYKEWTRLMTID